MIQGFLIGLVFLACFFIVFNILIYVSTWSQRERIREAKRRLELISEGSGRKTDPSLNILKDELLSDIPGINRLLLEIAPINKLVKLINQANGKTKPSVVILLSFVLAFVTGYILTTFQPIKSGPVELIIFSIALLVGCIPFLYLIRRRQMRFRKFEEQLPDALELISRALRSGHTFVTAMELVADELRDPISTEFERAYAQQNLGLPLKQALLNLMDRMPLMDVRFFVTAVLIQRETGGNLAETLDNLSYIIRERFKLLRHVYAISGEQRFQALILFILPILLAIIITFLNPKYLQILIEDKLGRVLLISWSFFLVLGLFVIRRIIRIKI